MTDGFGNWDNHLSRETSNRIGRAKGKGFRKKKLGKETSEIIS